MGQQYKELSAQHQDFIQQQKIYFVASATADSLINVSPKGMDSLRILNPNRVIWLNLTGSGNETSAHIQQDGRMTIMFAAFEGKPVILRLYGKARVIHHNDTEWKELFMLFDYSEGARQIFDLKIDMVQISCGMAVPYFDYKEDRPLLNDWSINKGEQGLKDYWVDRNQQSLDGIATHIKTKNT